MSTFKRISVLSFLFVFLMLPSFSFAGNQDKQEAKLQKEFGHDLTHAPFFLRFAYYKEFDKDWKETDYLERKAFLGDYETQSAAEQAKEEAEAKAQIAKEKERLRAKQAALRKEQERLKAEATEEKSVKREAEERLKEGNMADKQQQQELGQMTQQATQGH